MPHNNHPRTLAEFGITLDQYNKIIYNRNHKATADLWFGTCCNRPIHNFVQIAKVRNLSPVTVRTHMLYVFGSLKQYSDDQIKFKIEEDIFQICLALFKHYEMPYRSYQPSSN